MKQNKWKYIYLGSLALFILAMIAGGVEDLRQTPDFLSNTEPLGYPLYFYTLLGIAKILGSLILILRKKIPAFIVMMAYSGFIFDLSFAILSYSMVGLYPKALVPLPFLALLILNYYSYSKLADNA